MKINPVPWKVIVNYLGIKLSITLDVPTLVNLNLTPIIKEMF